MSTTETQSPSTSSPSAGLPPGPVPEGASFARRVEERAARWFTLSRLPVVARRRDEAEAAVRALPERLQRLTNQTSLVLELVDDFRARRYRDVSWTTVAVATAALLYCVSPADAIPDFIPGIGVMDEAIVLGLATRIVRGDLIRYAEYKGYDRRDYFA